MVLGRLPLQNLPNTFCKKTSIKKLERSNLFISFLIYIIYYLYAKV